MDDSVGGGASLSLGEPVRIPPPDRSDGDNAVLVSWDDYEALVDRDQVEDIGLRQVKGSSAVGLRMAEIAESQRGVRESGGEDRGVPYERYVKPFGAGPNPWCAFFVSWCYWQTTGSRPPWSNPGYVPTVYSWASAAGRLTANPKRGDMFGVSGSHMGLVSARLRDGQILTIEGNWSDAVVSMRRPISGLWYATP